MRLRAELRPCSRGAGAGGARRAWTALGFALAAAACACHPVRLAQPDGGLVWQPAPAVLEVAGAPPAGVAGEWVIPASAAEAELTVGPNRTARFWLEPLGVARVQWLDAAANAASPLRYRRLLQSERVPPGARPSRLDVAAAAERSPGQPRDDYLVQPPGRGSLWSVDAAVPARVRIERPRLRKPHLMWAAAEAAILEWVVEGGPIPAFPARRGACELTARLARDQQLATLLATTFADRPALLAALEPWRKARALEAIDGLRPLISPLFALIKGTADPATALGPAEHVRQAGADPSAPPASRRPYERIDAAERTWQRDLEGPGVLRLESRALRGVGLPDEPPATLRVIGPDGRTAELELSAQPARVRPAVEPGKPVRVGPAPRVPLVTQRGEPVGRRAVLTISLAPGNRRYRFTLDGGPALLRAVQARRRPFAADRPAEAGAWLERARQAVAGDPVARAWFVRLLEPLPAAPTGPAPAAAPPWPKRAPGALRLLAALHDPAAQPRSPEAAAAALKRWQPWLAALDDRTMPQLAGQLRGDIARLLHAAGATAALARFLNRWPDSPATSWPARLADLLPQPLPSAPLKSRALRHAQRAWRTAPLDPAPRRPLLSVWHNATVWSRLRPAAAPGPATAPPQPFLWLRTLPDLSAEQVPLGASPAAAHWWPLRPGESRRCRSAAPRFTPLRPAVLRFYVLDPAGGAAEGPVTLSVDGRDFVGVTFEAAETWDIAAPPGEHTLALKAPAGIAVYSDCAPLPEDRAPAAPPAAVVAGGAQLLRLWPLRAADGTPLRFRLPEPQVPAPVRLLLAEVGGPAPPGEPSPRPVTLRSNTGLSFALTWHAGAVDPASTPISAPGPLISPVAAVLDLPAGVSELWLEADPALPLVAAVSIRRARPATAASPGPTPADPAAAPDAAPAAGPGPPSGAASGPAPASRVAQRRPTSGSPEGPASAPEVGAPDAPAAPAAAATAEALAELNRLSHALRADPAAFAPRLARTRLLLTLGQHDLAEADLRGLLAQPLVGRSLHEQTALDALVAQLAEGRSRHLLPLPAPPQALAGPAPLRPALLQEAAAWGLAGPRPWWPVVQALRRDGPAAALPLLEQVPSGDAALAAMFASRLRSLAGQWDEAARAATAAYLATYRYEWGLEAVRCLLQALDPARAGEGSADTAALAVGVAATVIDQAPHRAAERLLALAGEQTGWQAIEGTENAAGWLALYQTKPVPTDLPLRTAVRQALLPTPWSADAGQFVYPGHAAVLAVNLKDAAQVAADVWCQPAPAPPNVASAAVCPLIVQVDQQAPQRVTVPAGRLTRVPIGDLAAGGHYLEIALAEQAVDGIAALRFLADRPVAGADAPLPPPGWVDFVPIAARRPLASFVATERHPVVVTVVGPGALRVEGRAKQPGRGAAALAVGWRPLSGSPAFLRRVPLPAAIDESVTTAPGVTVARTVGQAKAFVVPLPEARPYRVTLSPQGATALVRLALCTPRPAGGVAPPRPPRQPPLDAYVGAGDGVARQPADRPLFDALAAPFLPDPPPGRAGSWSLGVAAGRRDAFAAGSADPNGPFRLETTLDWRLQAVSRRLWLRVSPQAYGRPAPAAPAWGGELALVARHLFGPADLQLDLGGSAFTERLDGADAWSAQGRIRLARAWRPAPDLQLHPFLQFRYYHASLAATPGPARRRADRLVFDPYAVQHRYPLRAGLTAYWRPFVDHVFLTGLEATTNDDFRVPDRADFRLGWRGVFGLSAAGTAEAALTVRSGYRFADAHRAVGFFRQDLQAELRLSLWSGRQGRMLLHLRDLVWLTSRLDVQNLVWLGLRYDWTLGRGLTDFLPSEEDFPALVERRFWQPANGDGP